MRVSFLRPIYFVWVWIPVAIYFAYVLLGSPYLLWSYTWRDDGRGYEAFGDRHYLRCTYAGPTGSFTVRFPARGECPWVRFYKSRAGGDG